MAGETERKNPFKLPNLDARVRIDSLLKYLNPEAGTFPCVLTNSELGITNSLQLSIFRPAIHILTVPRNHLSEASSSILLILGSHTVELAELVLAPLLNNESDRQSLTAILISSVPAREELTGRQ